MIAVMVHRTTLQVRPFLVHQIEHTLEGILLVSSIALYISFIHMSFTFIHITCLGITVRIKNQLLAIAGLGDLN